MNGEKPYRQSPTLTRHTEYSYSDIYRGEDKIYSEWAKPRVDTVCSEQNARNVIEFSAQP